MQMRFCETLSRKDELFEQLYCWLVMSHTVRNSRLGQQKWCWERWKKGSWGIWACFRSKIDDEDHQFDVDTICELAPLACL